MRAVVDQYSGRNVWYTNEMSSAFLAFSCRKSCLFCGWNLFWIHECCLVLLVLQLYCRQT